MSRTKRVDDRQEMERVIDELFVRGYEIKSQDEASARLKEKDWGDGSTHLILVVLTGWWTFGLANALYGVYMRATADEIVVTVEE